MSLWLTLLFNGLSLSSILLLIALGLAFSFGLMKVINMAHGELIMAGAYVTYLLSALFGRWFGPAGAASYFLPALVVSFVVTALLGLLLEATLIVLILLLAAPLLLSDFRLNLLGKFVTFAIAALALDLIWGYAGLMSLGQGVFFGLGAYAMAMHLKLESSGGKLPDFMSWSGLSALPWFWAPFHSAWFALAMAVLIPMLLAGALGYMVFRSRITGVYFSIITQALALIMSILFIGQQPYTGGTNGITNLTTIFGFPLTDPKVKLALFLTSVLILALVYVLCATLTRARFGRLLVALRDDETRVRFSGYDPARIKLWVFALAGGISGLAGALFVPQVGIISPAAMGIVPSVEMVIWVAVGGRGTLIGAVIGALLINAAKSGLSESFPAIWQYFLGALFIGAVLLFPNGLVGAVTSLRRHRSRPAAMPPLTHTELPAMTEMQQE